MHVIARCIRRRESVYDAIAEVVRVRTGEAKTPDSRNSADCANEVGEIKLAVVIRVHSLAKQHDLRHALFDDLPRLAHYVGEPTAPLRPSCRRHDAIRTSVVTAALYRNPRLYLVEPARRKILVVLFEIEVSGRRANTATSVFHE